MVKVSRPVLKTSGSREGIAWFNSLAARVARVWVNKPLTKSPPPIYAPVKGSGATDRLGRIIHPQQPCANRCSGGTLTRIPCPAVGES